MAQARGSTRLGKLREDGGERRASTTKARGSKMTSFEIALVVAYNAFTQWAARCATASGLVGFSPFDAVILNLVNTRLMNKRAADICFALKVEDAHTVAYALKKLGNAGLVTSQRIGKETLFRTTEEGARICDRYHEARRTYLIEAVSLLDADEFDIDEIASFLHALSGMYEQAARNAATAS
jgi:predicted MarR family transcription regulator